MIDQLIAQISPENITNYFRRKLPTFKPVTENLDHVLREKDFDQFSNLLKHGEVTYGNSDELLVFSCRYRGELSSRSSKHKQYDIAKKVLKEEFKDGAIFVFFDETGKFRFSYIRKHYGDKDKRYSNWKRYTYFVDPAATNKTFRKRIEDCQFTSLDGIQESFSVEPLNKEFYERIVREFYSLVGGEAGSGKNKEVLKPNLTLPGGITDRTIIRQFGVRLIGRIIFCWFLKHKTSSRGVPLIPKDWLSSDKVSGNFYHSKLELLFFEILNTPVKERIKNLPDDHVLIPFLNGGLFEPQNGNDCDYYEIDKITVEQRANYQLKIADDWFKELFELLEQYNFTIDENSINDAEVSIDPEMLGRIFENLLAEIDPNLTSSETTSVRKSTGSFYTPREIVDFMAEEALMKYLHNKTGICEKSIHHLFFDDGLDEFTPQQKEDLIEAFNQVKILDPAAGSGAFPMGCLHKITTALQKLDPGAEKWKEKQLEKITNAALKSEIKAILDKSNAEYARKLGILQQCIYGADIQPIAAEISRLRSFLSLIVEEEIDDTKYNRGILALPNLEFKFVTANTLVNLEHGQFETNKVQDLIPELHKIRLDYLQSHGSEKIQLRKKFSKIQSEIFEDQLKINQMFHSATQGRAMQLAGWDPFKNEVTQWFDPEWMFGVKQFDIVIGNPPYGGTKIPDEMQTKLGLGSKDPYGAFIAKFLHRKGNNTPLKHEGILAYIVSDTFMTIKTHKPLRDLMLDNQVHAMIRVHPDTFKATVNTAVIICERHETPKEKSSPVLMADFTNISIHEQHDRFIQLLDVITDYAQPEYTGEATENNGVLYMKGLDWTSESSEEYAVYTYPQNLILTNSNHPFFVASPKLFGLMNDTTAPKRKITVEGKEVQARVICINDKEVEVVKLEQIAEVKQGLATGDNDAYLFQNPEARGSYRDINLFREFLLTEDDLNRIRQDEKLRKDVIFKGISKTDIHSERYFGGRYIVPYDKGGESDSDEGWMPNYYVPTNYFIDWSEWAVERMQTLTTAERNRIEGKPGGDDRLCSRFQNVESYFIEAITFSPTGVYCPTFRFHDASVYDKEGSCIFSSSFDILYLLSILTSKVNKLIQKCIINGTVHSMQGDVQLSLIPMMRNMNALEKLVDSIKTKQKEDLTFDYSSQEQLIIDFFIYQESGFSIIDIQEIENWYARRYPKLVAAQKRNLAALGKPTNYIEIYRELAKKYADLES
jgi:type I restriction-modification system DNA methylase subunit